MNQKPIPEGEVPADRDAPVPPPAKPPIYRWTGRTAPRGLSDEN